MQLSLLHLFIDHGNYNGILRFEILKEFHNLCIAMSLYKININQKESIDIFKNNLAADPSNPKIIEIIPTKFVHKEVFQLSVCENICDYLIDKYKQNVYVFEISNLKFVLDQLQARRLCNFFNSFVTNFALIDSIYNIYLNMAKLNAGEPVDTVLAPVKPEPVVETPVIVEKIEQQPNLAPKENNYDYILNYLPNQLLKNYFIESLFKHLLYIYSVVDINDSVSNKVKTIKLPSLFNINTILNSDYVINILNTSLIENNVDQNVFNFNLNKIKKQIIDFDCNSSTNSNYKIELLILIFIYYIYQYKYIVSNYNDFDIETYFTAKIQEAALNYFFKQESITFSIIEDYDPEQTNEQIEEDQNIKSISDKYKHLKTISNTDFLDLVIKDLSQQQSKQNPIIFNDKKLIDIKKILKYNESLKKVIDPVQNTSEILLNYSNQNQNAITQAYNYLLSYTRDNTSITNILNKNIIPAQVLNLFDFLSKQISKIYTDKTIISTFQYYQILRSNLPAPSKISHYSYMYMIFNIIIPYYYHNHNVTIFEDCLL